MRIRPDLSELLRVRSKSVQIRLKPSKSVSFRPTSFRIDPTPSRSINNRLGLGGLGSVGISSKSSSSSLSFLVFLLGGVFLLILLLIFLVSISVLSPTFRSILFRITFFLLRLLFFLMFFVLQFVSDEVV